MLKSREREKLINAVVYFASNTKHCGKIKLIKLLYLLDFEHFRQAGCSVTGMDYSAWKLGPVPAAFFQEWEQWQPDFASAIEIRPERVIDHELLKVVPKADFDDSCFTPRELRLMKQLAERFRDERSQPLINFTHDEIGPWSKIWEGGRGFLNRIPYALAIRDDDPHADAVRESAVHHRSIRQALGATS